MNNPLAFTDPSGAWPRWLQDFFKSPWEKRMETYTPEKIERIRRAGDPWAGTSQAFGDAAKSAHDVIPVFEAVANLSVALATAGAGIGADAMFEGALAKAPWLGAGTRAALAEAFKGFSTAFGKELVSQMASDKSVDWSRVCEEAGTEAVGSFISSLVGRALVQGMKLDVEEYQKELEARYAPQWQIQATKLVGDVFDKLGELGGEEARKFLEAAGRGASGKPNAE